MKTLTKQVFTGLLIIFTSIALVIGCQKKSKETTNKQINPTTGKSPEGSRVMAGDQWFYTDPATGITLTYSFTLSNSGTDTFLTTSLVLVDNSANLTVDYGIFNLDKNNVRDKDALGLIFANAYRNIYVTYGTTTLQTYSGLIEKMLTSIAATVDVQSMKSLKYQSLCMFNTLAKAVNRDIYQSGRVEFTVMEGYLRGLSSFSAEEDERLDIRNFKLFLASRRGTVPNEGIDYFLNALRSESGTLNMKQVTTKLDIYFTSTYGRWPQGGQCGCCGNYSGACWYWSSVCLVHDYQCQNCSPSWYCLPGCVASSCSGNTISWYWFL
jgi:hypothetical protein